MKISKSFLFSVIALLLLSSLASAGGPILVDQSASGNPLAWPSIIWRIENSNLNNAVSAATVKGWVQGTFDTWKDSKLDGVVVADLDIGFGGWLSNANYERLLDEEGVNIVFDHDGTIIDGAFGEGEHEYIAGFARPSLASGLNLVGGIMVLNGLFLDGAEPVEISEADMKAVITHEVGHLLNLDHTQLDVDPLVKESVPTMYPYLLTSAQSTLHVDDVVSLAGLYPSGYFRSYYCTIVGELLMESGEGLQGANVVAYAVDPEDEMLTLTDARSYVSGVAYPQGVNNGEYILGGIVAGREYDVVYEEINPQFTGGSSLEPFDPPRTGIGEGLIAKGVKCDRSGDMIQLDPFYISVNFSAGEELSDKFSSNEAVGPAPGCGGHIQEGQE